MAGPVFDIALHKDHKSAAKNVQCIHTSYEMGTHFYNACHQDWRMGNCGFSQIASSDPPCNSHGLCPYMYVNAFDYNFIAIPKPKRCPSIAATPTIFPVNYRMGYLQPGKG